MPKSDKIGPQVQKMDTATEELFKQANDRAKLLDTPPLSSHKATPLSKKTEAAAAQYFSKKEVKPTPPTIPPAAAPLKSDITLEQAEKPNLCLQPYLHPSEVRPVRLLTVQDIIDERYLTDPELGKQYQEYCAKIQSDTKVRTCVIRQRPKKKTIPQGFAE